MSLPRYHLMPNSDCRNSFRLMQQPLASLWQLVWEPPLKFLHALLHARPLYQAGSPALPVTGLFGLQLIE